MSGKANPPPDDWFAQFGKRPPWAQNVMQLFKRLTRVAERRGAEDPEGVAQEALARFLTKIREHPDLLDQDDVYPYLRTFVINVLREICKRRLKPGPLDYDHSAPEKRLGALRQFEVEQFFRECLKSLDPQDREMMIWDAEGRGHEWRTVHGVSDAAFRSRLCRLRKRLSTLFLERGKAYPEKPR